MTLTGDFKKLFAPLLAQHSVLLALFQAVDRALQVIGHGGFESHFLASLRIHDGQFSSVQRLAFQYWLFRRQVKTTFALKLCRMNLAVTCIKTVTDNRAANV